MHQAWSFPALDVSEALTVERAALLDRLRACTPEDWLRPTPCPAWSVHGLVAHVLHDDLRGLSASRDGHGGAQFNGSRDALGPWLDGRNELFVEAFTDCSPSLLVELLEWIGPRARAQLLDAPPYQPALGVSWAGAEPMAPSWLHVAREFTERWTHQHQLRRALGAPALLDPVLVGPLLATWRWALVPVLPAHDAEDFMVAIEGHAPWSYRRIEGEWLVTDEPEERIAPDVVLNLDAAIAWLTSDRAAGPPAAVPAVLASARAIVV